jgi:hypothetical protein
MPDGLFFSEVKEKELVSILLVSPTRLVSLFERSAVFLHRRAERGAWKGSASSLKSRRDD